MSDEAIHKAIDAARTFLQDDAERLAYINRELAIHRDAFEEGEAKGRAEGIEKGRAEERKSSDNRWEKLMSLLLEEKRYDEAKKAASSKEFREILFKKYGLE